MHDLDNGNHLQVVYFGNGIERLKVPSLLQEMTPFFLLIHALYVLYCTHVKKNNQHHTLRCFTVKVFSAFVVLFLFLFLFSTSCIYEQKGSNQCIQNETSVISVFIPPNLLRLGTAKLFRTYRTDEENEYTLVYDYSRPQRVSPFQQEARTKVSLSYISYINRTSNQGQGYPNKHRERA